MSRALYQLREINNALPVQIRLEDVEIVDGFVQRVINVVGDAALFFRRRLERRIGIDARDEVLTQVGRKISKTAIAQDLSGAQDGGRVNMKALGHLARRKKASLVGCIKNGAQ